MNCKKGQGAIIHPFLNTITDTIHSLPVAIFYVTEGCNLGCITCSYRDKLPDELSVEEIETLAGQLGALGLRRIVYSGGEPLLRRDFIEICKIFQKRPVKQSLLTNGVLLGKRIDEIAPFLDEIIISLDGADAATHDAIRGVRSFDIIIENIRLTRQRYPGISISLRTVIQKKNFHQLRDIVELGIALSLQRVSFLSVDVLSEAFGREHGIATAGESELLLSQGEIEEFRDSINKLAETHSKYFASGFISESVPKLTHLADYFEAALAGKNFPHVNCNAPMVSTVITSTGNVLPCFFLPPLGNIRKQSLQDILNGKEAKQTRRNVRNYAYERCHTCVCSLHVSPLAVLKAEW